MKNKHVSETARTVAQARETMAPKVPCVNANAEGYCTGPCEGALCCKCADYKPAEITAIAVRVDDLPMPEGSPAEQANALHRAFLKSAKTTAVRAVQCGWVLSNVRASCGHGAWQHWVAENLEFAERTAYNYIAAYEKTVGAARAGMRRPVPLSVEPTMKEIESACSQVAEQPMTDLYRATGLVERRAGWGGAGRGQGRKPRDAEAEAAELDAIANNPALLFAAVKGPLDELWRLHRERDVFARLGDEELTQVAGVLQPLYKYAAGILKDRAEARTGNAR